MQLHLSAARAGELPESEQQWLQLSTSKGWTGVPGRVGAEAGTAGDDHGEQHAVAAQGKVSSNSRVVIYIMF